MARHPPNQTGSDGTATPPLWEHEEHVRRTARNAAGILLLLDFDGTLAPITDRPDEATIRSDTAARLEAIHAHPDATVAVVTGRELADIRSRIPVACRLAANHGLELASGDEKIVHPTARETKPSIAAVCDDLTDRLAGIEGAFVEDKGLTASVHYRLASEEETDEVRRAVQAAVDEHGEPDQVKITEGKQVVELRPRVEWHKGRAVEWLQEQCIPADEDWLSVYLGDDRTDESAFRALGPADIGIKVGEEITDADYRIGDTAAVVRFLDLLETALDEP